MKRNVVGLLAILVAAVLALGGGRAVATHDDRAEATPAAMSMGAAYLVITNNGPSADRLIGARTSVARAVEIHEVVDKGGVMTMRPLADGLEIPAGGSVTLEPGGYHLMLIGLTRSLVAGSIYDLTLTFATAGDLTVTVPVYASEAAAAAATPAAPAVSGAISIDGAWSRPAPAVGSGAEHGGSAAAFMTIANNGADADTLIGARTDIAAAAEIHEVKKGEHDVMTMAPLEHGLEIPAGGRVTLEPGGYHVMLLGLTRDLTAGTSYELTLVFAHAGEVTITVPVQPAAPDAAAASPVTIGALEISGPWTRPAPALSGDDGHDDDELETDDEGHATPRSGM